MKQILRGTIIEAPELGKLHCVPHGCLLVDNGIIAGVTPDIPADWADAAVSDYGDALILQGFVDCHLHAPQYPFVGTGMDVQLLEWLQKYAFPNEAKFKDLDYARKVYRQLADELISNGTTRVIMFSSLHTNATFVLMEELERAGVGGYVGKVNMDRNNSPELNESTEESKQETLRWLAGCARFTKVRPILTPRFTPSCTNELMQWLGEVGEERGLYVHSHLSENPSECEWVKELHPDCARYYETYKKYGLWKDHTVMAHCVYSDEEERYAMREANVMAVHCPDSNTNVRSGICPVRVLLEEGNWVSLGSDIAGGSHLPMTEVMAVAIQVSKINTVLTGKDSLTAAEVYFLATSAGQRYFEEKPGFAVGNPLHAVVFDDSPIGFLDQLTPELRLERLLYRSRVAKVSAVYSDGKQVYGA